MMVSDNGQRRLGACRCGADGWNGLFLMSNGLWGCKKCKQKDDRLLLLNLQKTMERVRKDKVQNKKWIRKVHEAIQTIRKRVLEVKGRNKMVAPTGICHFDGCNRVGPLYRCTEDKWGCEKCNYRWFRIWKTRNLRQRVLAGKGRNPRFKRFQWPKFMSDSSTAHELPVPVPAMRED